MKTKQKKQKALKVRARFSIPRQKHLDIEVSVPDDFSAYDYSGHLYSDARLKDDLKFIVDEYVCGIFKLKLNAADVRAVIKALKKEQD